MKCVLVFQICDIAINWAGGLHHAKKFEVSAKMVGEVGDGQDACQGRGGEVSHCKKSCLAIGLWLLLCQRHCDWHPGAAQVSSLCGDGGRFLSQNCPHRPDPHAPACPAFWMLFSDFLCLLTFQPSLHFPLLSGLWLEPQGNP